MFCPKCENEYQAGFELCADCQVPLVESLVAPASPEAAEEEEERQAASFFPDGEEEIIYCPSCWTEFAVVGARCMPCGGVEVALDTRSRFEREVAEGPQTRLIEISDLDADARDAGLVCIHRADTPHEAAFLYDSLTSMGAEAELGHDGLDGEEDPRRVGLWVPPNQVEAAAMLIPEGEGFEAPTPKGDPYGILLREAELYLEFEKFHAARELVGEAIELDGDRPEAFERLGEIAAQQGLFEAATQGFEQAIERAAALERREGYISGCYWFAALYSFVALEETEAGLAVRPSYSGPRADRGWAHLKEYLERGTRFMPAWLVKLDVAAERGHDSVVRETLRAIEDLNPMVFRIAGRHTEIRDRFA